MGSTRLSNKVLKEVDGKPMIGIIIDRIKQAKEINGIVIATSDKEKDDAIEKFAEKINTECFRGSEEDLLDRLYNAGKKYGADAILRLTGDNPIIDEKIIDKVARTFRKQYGKISLVSTCVPMTFPEGLSMELIDIKTLEKLHNELKTPAEREGFAVIVHMKKNEKIYLRHTIASDTDQSRFRLSVDYPEDFHVVEKIIKHFKKNNQQYFSINDVVHFLESHPNILKINSQKQDRSKYPFVADDNAVQKAR